MKHVDLFSGIGGFALAARWAGFTTTVFCEKDKFCQKVLNKHWPNVPIIEDIHDEFNWKQYTDTTLLTGGFPCQPFSVAGKRRGKADDRYLWPQMFRVISTLRPTWVLAENVTGIIDMELDKTLTDLESEGYETITFNIPACGVDAPHKRERIWIVAHASQLQCNGGDNNNGIGTQGEQVSQFRDSSGERILANTDNTGPQRYRESGQCARELSFGTARPKEDTYAIWDTEPDVGRLATGIPHRVDRLRSLGNAIVPQVAYEIIKGIRYIHETA